VYKRQVYDYCGETAPAYASNTIDGNLITYWAHNALETHWIAYDLGRSYNVSEVRVYAKQRKTGSPCALTAVYVSDDPSNWGSNLLTSECSFSNTLEWQICDNQDAIGRYVKIVMKTWSIICNYNLPLSYFYEFNAAVSDNPPVSTLLNPPNGTVDGDGNVTFSCSATDDIGLSNLTLYVWNSTGLYYNNTKSINGKSNQSSWTLSLNEGNYSWNCLAYDNGGNYDWAENWTLTVNFGLDEFPVVELSEPLNNSLKTTAIVTFKCNVSDDRELSNLTLYVWKQGVVYYSNTRNVSGTFNSSSWDVTLENGNFEWNCLAYDNSSQGAWAPFNFTLSVDLPPQWSNLGQNNSQPEKGEAIQLYTFWQDNSELGVAILETNETGTWENKTGEGLVLCYTIEGNWNNPIRGSGELETCTNETISKPFTSVNISAKVDYVRAGGDLWFRIRRNSGGSPTDVVTECNAPDPTGSNQWRSCTAFTEQQPPGVYWLCAYSANGSTSTTYFNINYGFDVAHTTARNESGSWVSYPIATVIKGNFELYDSPIDLTGLSSWSNFTWLNGSIEPGTVVGWRIWANDSRGTWNVTDIMSFTIQPTLAISLLVNSTDFGSMELGEINDTTDNVPLPITVQNDGNVKVNIAIEGTSLWKSEPNPTPFYQYLIGIHEPDSFNSSCSTITWSDVLLSNNNTDICELNYKNSKDTAEIELKVQVPYDEPAGNKNSTIVLTAEAA